MKGRLLIAAGIAAFSLFSYCGTRQQNPVTGEVQNVSISPEQEVALGLQSAPQMARQFGGLDPDPKAQRLVDEVGQQVVASSEAARSPYQFEFHALRDPKTVNAFALPGGQIFVTRGLLRRLETRGQLAGVLAHEVGHVVARHGAEHLAKQRLTQGLTGAAVIAGTDPRDPSTYRNAAVAVAIGQLINLRYGRKDELESDRIGLRYMTQAGYDPRAMVEVMRILGEAGAGRGGPEFFQTHPNPQNRVQRIQEGIREEFPNGLPEGLQP